MDHTLTVHGIGVTLLAREMRRRGCRTRVFTNFVEQSYCHLYVWHEPTLQALLDSHRKVLIRNKWPTAAAAFVHRVSNTFAEDPHLFRLVGRAFADNRKEWPHKMVPDGCGGMQHGDYRAWP